MNIDDIIENARLKGRIIALEGEVQTLQAEVRCLEAVIRSHERVDCLTVANLKADLAKSEEHNDALCERLQDLNGEVHTASCINARLHSQFANSEQENARLKADVVELADALKLASEVGIKVADEVTRLQAEVERLEKGIQPEGCNDAVGRAVNVLLEKEKEIARLQAEVERLRKAGTEMGKHLPDTDEANRAYIDFEAGGRS